MSYKCSVCGINEVEHYGDVCELCAISQDPYAINASSNQNSFEKQMPDSTYAASTTPKKSSSRKILLDGAKSSTNLDPFGNDMTPTPETPVQVYSAGQMPQNVQQTPNTQPTQNTSLITKEQPLTSGITKNISVDDQKKSFLSRWIRSLTKGVPFTFDDDITMFQVFPDFTGSATNASGNACDQVILYGKINAGVISENNDVEVYGRRDSNNNIIAKSIKNKASGTTVKPNKCISAGIIWAVTAIVIALFAALVFSLGFEGIIWIAVLVICLTNLPLVIKIIAALFAAFISLVRRV